MSKTLDVYLCGQLAGKLFQNISGVLSFSYASEYVETGQMSLSLSMPLRKESYERDTVRAFFSGLLPDDLVRHRLARYLGVSEKNPFALLEAIGGECAGALSLYPEGQKPPKETWEDAEILDEQRLKSILDLLRRRPLLAGDDGLRLSLAGAQDKIAVGLQDGKITLVKGATPTTHILKPVIAEIESSAHNELFCMRLAALVGLEVPHTEIRFIENMPYFLVERYDRIKAKGDGGIERLHQEDFCQAMGIMPDIKYEREGGPSYVQCQALLKSYSTTPAADQISFLNRIIFNYLIGNADAHGKNFSLLYKNKKPQLAPAYDLLSTAVYPELSANMAMKIGKKYSPNDVFMRHWHTLVPDTKTAQRGLEKQLYSLSEKCIQKAQELKLTLKNEGIEHTIFEEIIQIIHNRATRITRPDH